MIKRSLSLQSHRTSVALEAEFWTVIDAFVASSDTSLAGFIAGLDAQRIAERSRKNLASYLRVWVLNHIRNTP